ncbi:MAG: Na+/H+ antiporter subunit G [Marinobacter sp.]
MNPFIEYIIAGLLLLGAIFTLVGAIGLAVLPDFFTRLHGPTKATTVGVGAMALASMIWFANQPGGTGFVEILIMVFLLLTAPPSANMMAKAAMHMELPKVDNTRGDPWQQ